MTTRSPKILAFAGSARKDSYNKRLVQAAARGAEQAGAEVTFVDFRDYEMPIFDEDYETEHGAPESVTKFKQLMKEHDGFLISSPEYNSSVSALLKNAIDWASRPADGEAPLEAFAGKTAGLLSASPGGLGGLRGLVTLRSILGNIRMLVIPEQYALGGAHSVFDEEGNVTDADKRALIEGIGSKLAEVTKRQIAG